jgi:serine/threonine protein kinase
MKKNPTFIEFKDTHYEKKLNKNELEITKYLQGKNILPDFYIEDDILYIEAYDLTLKDYITKNNFYDESELGDIPKQLYKLIDKVHQLGIVHLDIHTGNIVLKETKEGYDVRLIDFELSRWIDTLTEEDMEDCKTFLPYFSYGEDYIQDLLNYEYEMWKYDYFL